MVNAACHRENQAGISGTAHAPSLLTSQFFLGSANEPDAFFQLQKQ